MTDPIKPDPHALIAEAREHLDTDSLDKRLAAALEQALDQQDEWAALVGEVTAENATLCARLAGMPPDDAMERLAALHQRCLALEGALRSAGKHCEDVHHAKGDEHGAGPCPVEARIDALLAPDGHWVDMVATPEVRLPAPKVREMGPLVGEPATAPAQFEGFEGGPTCATCGQPSHKPRCQSPVAPRGGG